MSPRKRTYSNAGDIVTIEAAAAAIVPATVSGTAGNWTVTRGAQSRGNCLTIADVLDAARYLEDRELIEARNSGTAASAQG